MPKPAKPTFPAFRERAPWWGTDLQTLRNTWVGVDSARPGSGLRQVGLPMSDASGDVLVGHLETPPAAGPQRETIVLVHGLGGSADSQYIHASTAHWLGLGHAVARLDLRGAGASGPSCRLSYHAGRSQDLRDALDALRHSEPALFDAGIALVGYSLGGNMLLKFLAEYGAAFPIRWAGSVSTPLDLDAASRRFREPRNYFYQRHILAGLRRESLREAAAISPAERAAVLAAKSVFEFDEHYVAPRNGFVDAADYYARSSSQNFLADIPVPTLIVHALNDPWISASVYTGYDWSRNPRLTPLLARRGGHVGFHGRGQREAWHDVCLGIFATAQRS